jgi:hypothetical protein
MAGISGAFLILPFQMSVLGFVTPSVSATNFLYNVVGTPGGILPPGPGYNHRHPARCTCRILHPGAFFA